MSKCQGWYHETSGAFEGGKFWMGLGGFGGWCHGTATCLQGLASNRSLVNKMPCFLQTLAGNLFVLEPPFFGGKFLMCPSKIVLQLPLFFSHSSRWLRPFLLSWARRSTPHFMDFWWDRFHWFDWLHCAYWLVAVHSFDVMLWFLDVEIGGKQRKKVPGIAFKHIQARCEFLN